MSIPDHALMTVTWIDPATVKHDSQPIDPEQVEFWKDLYERGLGQYAPPMLNADLTVRDGRHRLLALQHLSMMARVIIVDEVY